MRTVEEISGLLRKKGLKLTPQRRLIIEILLHDRSHPTVEDVYRKVLETMPEVSRTTVYNTIREMLNLGEVAEVQDLSDGGIRYDTDAAPHHHFFCIRCRALADLDLELPPVPESVPGLSDCVILRRQITLYGLCAQCREEEKEGEFLKPQEALSG
jgi:Fe2+ or Zn2+ uptake regulation protein